MTNIQRRLEQIRPPRHHPLTFSVVVGDVYLAKVLPVTAILADTFGAAPDTSKRVHVVDRDNLAAVRAKTEIHGSKATASAWDALAAVVNEHEASQYNRLAIVDTDALINDPASLEDIVRRVSPACVFAASPADDPVLFRYLHRFLVPVVTTIGNESDCMLTWISHSPIHQTLQGFLASNSRYPIPGFQNVHVPLRSADRKDFDFNSVIQAIQIAASVHDMIRHMQPESSNTLSHINEWLGHLSVSRDTSEDPWPWQRYHFPLYQGSISGWTADASPNYELRVAPRCCKGSVITFKCLSTAEGDLECQDFCVRGEGI